MLLVIIMQKIIRIISFVPGFLIRLINLTIDGSRDFQNKRRFKKATIDNGCSINYKTHINKNSRVLKNSILNNVFLDSFSYVGTNSLIQNTSIGKFCSIANDVMIGLGSHPADLFSTSPLFYRKRNTFNIDLVDKNLDFQEYTETIIENDVWIGARATVLDGVKIQNGAIIAAGALVTRDVPPYAIVGGVPAKIISYRFEKSKIEFLLKSKWWNNELEVIKRDINTYNQI